MQFSVTRRKPTFVDVFAGCGGLSLGLLGAGMKGVFAIEKDESAFATLKANLLQAKGQHNFSWPKWLPKTPMSVEQLVQDFSCELRALAGKVDVLVGGPPCQGFSSAGRRQHDDPRNQMFKHYLQIIDLIEPKVILLENVRGFAADFPDHQQPIRNYADAVRVQLHEKYEVYEELIDLSSFGVPQARTRYFLVACLPGVLTGNPFTELRVQRNAFLQKLGLPTTITSWAALSDLEIQRGGTIPSLECPGFDDICPSRPRTKYQKLMRAEVAHHTDLRVANHSPRISERFEQIIRLSHERGRAGRSIGFDLRQHFNLKKTAIRVLDPDRPAPTITSMPDDLLHYSEPRTLSVRENARLQSFPDWFIFCGKYTSGGHRRRHEIPRFTQVANAVPPLAARALGEVLISMMRSSRTRETTPTVPATLGSPLSVLK